MNTLNSLREPIGVIGLGLLGRAIVDRLQQGGFRVVGFDLDSQACQSGSLCGVHIAKSAAGVVSDCCACVLCLPDSTVVQVVLDDCWTALHSGQIIIDSTTGDPHAMSGFSQSLADCGVGYIEASVAGSSAQMRCGEATLLLGGTDQTIAAARQVLAALSTRQFHVGPAGDGAKLKLVHNVILGLHRAVLAEGLGFGAKLGLSTAQMLEILQYTPAASEVMKNKGAKMIYREYSPQAKLSQHLKDVRLILASAEDAGAYTPLSSLHRVLLEQAIAQGLSDQDNSAIYELFVSDRSSDIETP